MLCSNDDCLCNLLSTFGLVEIYSIEVDLLILSFNFTPPPIMSFQQERCFKHFKLVNSFSNVHV